MDDMCAARWVASVLAVGLLAAGCTAESTGPRADEPSRSPSDSSPSGSSGSGSSRSETTPSAESPAPAASRTEAAKPPHPVSLPAYFDKEYDGGRLRLGQEIFRTAQYVQRFVSYRSQGLRISGIIDVPSGKGPFPVLILAHGYIDPAVYANGQGMRREQDYLARRGYVVLHTDYRGHAASSPAPQAEQRLRLGYTADVINAVLAVRRSRLPFLDGDRVGLVGRSMGGGVTYNVLVTQPGLVDAAVVFAPVSSNTVDNFNRWTRPERGGTAARIIRAYGSPERNLDFWRRVSPRTYFDRISEPLLIHHGTSDDSCPIRWSRRTMRALERADVDARMHVYPGEEHAFGPQWPLSMRRTVRFLERNL